MEDEIESEYFQDPEVDREWLEGGLAELQLEGRIQQNVAAERINQMLHIQAKTGYGSVFDLIGDHFPSLVTTYGRENLNGGFISELPGPPDEADFGNGPLSSTALHFDCEGIDQNAFRFYSKNDSENKYVITIVHKESGKRGSVTGRNFENVMTQAAIRAISLHYEYVLDKAQNILGAALERKNAIDYWDHFYVPPPDPVPASPALLEYPAKPQFNDPEPTPPTYLEYPPEPKPESVSGFEKAYSDWAWHIKQIESENQRRYDENVAAIKNWNYGRLEHEKAIAAWTETAKQIETENQGTKTDHLVAVESCKKEQINSQRAVANLRADYKHLDPEAVKIYCNLVLQSSDLPNGFGRKWDLEYVLQTKTLIVDHALPAPDDIVYVKKVELLKSAVD